MRRWEIAVGVLMLLVSSGCSSFVRKLRKYSFL
jgi:hypothetical protein